MFSLPRPRSSQLTTSAPASFTLEPTAWNFGASADADDTRTAVSRMVRIDTATRRMEYSLLVLDQPARARRRDRRRARAERTPTEKQVDPGRRGAHQGGGREEERGVAAGEARGMLRATARRPPRRARPAGKRRVGSFVQA